MLITKNDRCNYRERIRCLLKGNCLIGNVIYKATIKTEHDNNKLKPLNWNFKKI